jgi:hypothetical protein
VIKVSWFDGNEAQIAMMRVPSIPLTLAFEDLLPDSNGEIVIVSHGDHPQLSIVTERRVCDAGIAAPHVTADGVDVAGWAYFTFEGGTRLYYSPDIDLTIAPAQG